jgi:hypothetical protein
MTQESLPARLWAAFHDGGWMMWFIFVFGLLGAGATVRLVRTGEYRLEPFIRWILLTTIVSGLFGFSVGMTKVLHYVVDRAKPDERLVILLLGTREALSNINAALMFTTINCLLVAIAHRRHPQPNLVKSRTAHPD